MRHGINALGCVTLGCLALAGCASDSPLAGGLNPIALQAAPAEPIRDPSKQTLAGKMLAAIALERVTGRKPDPGRLAELN